MYRIVQRMPATKWWSKSRPRRAIASSAEVVDTHRNMSPGRGGSGRAFEQGWRRIDAMMTRTIDVLLLLLRPPARLQLLRQDMTRTIDVLLLLLLRPPARLQLLLRKTTPPFNSDVNILRRKVTMHFILIVNTVRNGHYTTNVAASIRINK